MSAEVVDIQASVRSGVRHAVTSLLAAAGAGAELDLLPLPLERPKDPGLGDVGWLASRSPSG